jgi:hypothetical protein
MGSISGRRPGTAAMIPPRGKAAPARDGHGSGRGFQQFLRTRPRRR